MSNPSIKYGVYAGVIMVILDLVLYLISEKALLMAGAYLALPVIIGAMIYASKDFKYENGGYGSFREIFTASWLSYLIAGLISTLFTFLLYNYLAPSLLDSMIQMTAESMEKVKGFMSEETYEKAMQQMDGSKNPMGLANTFIGLLTKYALAAIPALIIAGVMKKQPDPFA